MTRWTPSTLERVQVERQAGDERLALTGLHLGDVALVEDDPAHQLDVEHALVRLAEAGLANGGEGLEEQLLERLAVLEPLPELDGLVAQLARRRARWNSGSSEVMYAACSASRFMRRPSPNAEDLLEGAELGRHRET